MRGQRREMRLPIKVEQKTTPSGNGCGYWLMVSLIVAAVIVVLFGYVAYQESKHPENYQRGQSPVWLGR